MKKLLKKIWNLLGLIGGGSSMAHGAELDTGRSRTKVEKPSPIHFGNYTIPTSNKSLARKMIKKKRRGANGQRIRRRG
jgi:hypothetical protein